MSFGSIGVPSFPSFQTPYVPIPSTTRLQSRNVPKLIVRDDGLNIEFLSIPMKCARPVVNGDLISVHYVGRLGNGTIFDSSYDRKRPLDFVVGKFNSSQNLINRPNAK